MVNKKAVEGGADKGYLRIIVHTAQDALPVPDVAVTVISTVPDENGEQMVSYLVTDASGTAPVIELPVAPTGSTINPFDEFNYYTLRFHHEDYYPLEIQNVEVYISIP